MDRMKELKRNLSLRLRKPMKDEETKNEAVSSKMREEKKYMTWTIENIHVCPLKTGEYLESPPIYSGHLNSTKWTLRLYPRGRNENYSKKVGLFVCGIYSAVKCSIAYDFLSLDSLLLLGHFDNTFEDLGEYGTDEFLSTEDLSEVKSLKIQCNLTVRYLGEEEKYQISDEEFPNRSCTLSRDLKALYHQEKHTDAFLQVGETKMPAHKAILGARSRVFSDIFKRDRKKESCPNIIRIEEVEGPIEESVIRSLLEYVYAGKIDDVTVDKAASLYPLAKKYSLKELKKLCLNAILATMSVENFCRIATLADIHSSSKLKSAVKSFFRNYSSQIMDREEWKSFICERGSMASEMMETLASDMKSKSSAIYSNDFF